MSAEAWPEGYSRIVLDEVDSTSAHAGRIAGTLNGKTWILAHRQTSAYGRRGRPWAMAPGNFAATLAMRIAGTPAEAALRSFVASLALHEALAGLTGQPEALTLKWPNDVLLNGGKVAGILLENTGIRDRQSLTIGIGVNLAAAPGADEVETGAVRPVSVLGETGVEVTPEDFLDRLAAAFARWEDVLETLGFAPVREAWLARAARLGKPVTARIGSVTRQGTFETLDEAGALILRMPEGRIAIPAGDVYF